MKCVPILENFLNLVENLDSRMKAETAKEDVYLRMKLYLANQLIQELNGTELTMAIHVNNDNMVSFVFHWIGSKSICSSTPAGNHNPVYQRSSTNPYICSTPTA